MCLHCNSQQIVRQRRGRVAEVLAASLGALHLSVLATYHSTKCEMCFVLWLVTALYRTARVSLSPRVHFICADVAQISHSSTVAGRRQRHAVWRIPCRTQSSWHVSGGVLMLLVLQLQLLKGPNLNSSKRQFLMLPCGDDP
jgi:hypothetical protein